MFLYKCCMFRKGSYNTFFIESTITWYNLRKYSCYEKRFIKVRKERGIFLKMNDEQALEKLENAKHQVIDAIAETMDLYAVPPAAGRLYAIMQFEEQMNLDEMQDVMGMSKPSMSTSVRKLQEIDMMKKTFQRGSRKHSYIAEKNYFNTFISYFCHMWDREAKMNLTAIREAEFELDQIFEEGDVSEETLAKTRELYTQIEASKKYYRWLERLSASVRSREIFKYVPHELEDTDN